MAVHNTTPNCLSILWVSETPLLWRIVVLLQILPLTSAFTSFLSGCFCWCGAAWLEHAVFEEDGIGGYSHIPSFCWLWKLVLSNCVHISLFGWWWKAFLWLAVIVVVGIYTAHAFEQWLNFVLLNFRFGVLIIPFCLSPIILLWPRPKLLLIFTSGKIYQAPFDPFVQGKRVRKTQNIIWSWIFVK